MIRKSVWGAVVVVLSLAMGAPLRAENEGQEDLDKATELQLQVKSLKDIEEVIALCESAVRKGLDADNQQFAEDLLVGSLWQHASQLQAVIFDAPRPHPQWPAIRQLIRKDLDKLLAFDDTFIDAYVLSVKIELLPGGDLEKGRKALDDAIKFSDDKKKRSELLVLRSQMREEDEDRLADLTEALELDPANTEAWETRAQFFIDRGKLEEAVADFEALLKSDEKNLVAHQAVAEALANLERYDLALQHLEKAMEIAPDNSMNFTLRARVREQQGDLDEAMADLNKAVELNEDDVIALIARGTLHFRNDNLPAARADVERAMRINPNFSRAYLLRSFISAAEGRTNQAIEDLRLLVQNDPGNADLQLQLASYYVLDQRPRKAIEIYNEVIEADAKNSRALRARGDALLSIGKHADAVADYDKAIAIQPDDDGILNNLAWVLATSPVDEVRDGPRAVKLATRACEVTNYEAAHIVSTLAAAYAETGDFDAAIRWSTKAVELGEKSLPDQIEQLKGELESYKNGKPFREMQNIQEKADPPRRIIET